MADPAFGFGIALALGASTIILAFKAVEILDGWANDNRVQAANATTGIVVQKADEE